MVACNSAATRSYLIRQSRLLPRPDRHEAEPVMLRAVHAADLHRLFAHRVRRHLVALDVELIALSSRHPSLIAAVNVSPLDFDACPAWQAYEVSRDAIHDVRPITLAGMRAKVLVAKAEALRPDGTEDPDGTVAAHRSWDLVNDLLRLTGGVA